MCVGWKHIIRDSRRYVVTLNFFRHVTMAGRISWGLEFCHGLLPSPKRIFHFNGSFLFRSNCLPKLRYPVAFVRLQQGMGYGGSTALGFVSYFDFGLHTFVRRVAFSRAPAKSIHLDCEALGFSYGMEGTVGLGNVIVKTAR